MAALDRHFSAIVLSNPNLRPRVGNPDELRSNRLDATLDLLKHRVSEIEHGVAESRTGGVITALNEEAVLCAALGNKGGINLVVTYEAFAPKMLGALRQEITFARQQVRAGHAPGWLSVPVVLTSHTWENSKNEISHQDTTLVEALLGEMADAVSVVVPPDANATIAALTHAYASRGRIVAMVVPKRVVANVTTPDQARSLAEHGAITLVGNPGSASLIVAATGAYQLAEASRAVARLEDRGIATALVYVAEPGRLRSPRDALEAGYVMDDERLAKLFPTGTARVFITHTRPGPFLGALRRIDTGARHDQGARFHQPWRNARRRWIAVCQSLHLGAYRRAGRRRIVASDRQLARRERVGRHRGPWRPGMPVAMIAVAHFGTRHGAGQAQA